MYVIAFVLTLCGVVSASDLDRSLSVLENWGDQHGQNTLQEVSRIIKEHAPVGDAQVWGRLKGVIVRDDSPIAVRREALKMACEKSDGVVALEIMSLLTQWAVELDREEFKNECWREDAAVAAKVSLVATGAVYGLEYVQAVADDQGPILRFLTMMATRPEFGVHTYAVAAIAKNPATIEMRRSAALEVVRETPRYAVALEPLVRVLGRESIPELRKLLRRSKDAGEFHCHAAAILAHLGDKEILPDFEGWQGIPGPRGRHLQDYAKAWAWKIDVQHPPAKLLTYIASDDPRIGREWAARRAAELGVPKADLRKAILAHVERLKATGKKELYGRVIAMKLVGRELGVLRPDDLPDVKLPTESPTP